jgi:hypothetical protein
MEPEIVELTTEEDQYRFLIGHFEKKLVGRGMSGEAAASARETLDACLWAIVSGSQFSHIEVIQALTATWMDTAMMMAMCKFSAPDA